MSSGEQDKQKSYVEMCNEIDASLAVLRDYMLGPAKSVEALAEKLRGEVALAVASLTIEMPEGLVALVTDLEALGDRLAEFEAERERIALMCRALYETIREALIEG